ncbi:MAG TPA: flagellar hook-associated protein FlgL [Sulfuricella sp.]|nr:flagellar hook-associated protein FlgL [Sulfuricella sp.]
MRISSNTIYDLGVGSIQQQTIDMLHTQQQVSSGRRILAPSDDPVAAAQVLDVTQLSDLNSQFNANTTTATSSLQMEESILSSITSLIQDAQTLTVNAGNAALSNVDRASQATELQGSLKALLGLANSTDGAGQYMFAGYKGTTTPFTEVAPGNIAYNGDQGQRLISITSNRQVAVSDSGSDVFQRIKNGNGTFVTAASGTNTGSGIVSPGVVVDGTKWAASKQNYQIVFAVDNTGSLPVTTYDIIDPTTNNSMVTGAPSQALASATGGARFPRVYTSDSVISFKQLATDPGQPQYPASQPAGFATAAAWDYGNTVSINGVPASSQAVGLYAPAPGIDSFTVKASTNQDLFTTINNLITALQTPTTVTSGQAGLTNGLNTAMSNLDSALNNILTVRASVGARLKEISAVQNTGGDLSLQYQQVTSQLQDVDYAKAISDLTRQQTNLEAAQKSYLKVQGLSLFSMMP